MMNNHHEHFVASLSGAKPGFHELMMIGDLSSFLRWLDVVTVTTDVQLCDSLCLYLLIPPSSEYLNPQFHECTSLMRSQSLLSAKFSFHHFVFGYCWLVTNRYWRYGEEYFCQRVFSMQEPSLSQRNNRVCACSNKNAAVQRFDGLFMCYCLHLLLMNDDTCGPPLELCAEIYHCKAHLGLVMILA